MKTGKEQVFEVSLEGLEPGVLMNRYNPERQMEGPAKKSKNSFDISEWKDAIYADETGQIYIPANWIERAVQGIASNWKTPSSGRTTYKRWAQASMLIMPDEIPLDNVSLEDFEEAEDEPLTSKGNQNQKVHGDAGLYIARCVIRKSSVVRVRPFIYPWEIDFEVHARTDLAPADEELLTEMFNHAGSYPGIGDYRPENSGKFGRFEVKEVNMIQDVE